MLVNLQKNYLNFSLKNCWPETFALSHGIYILDNGQDSCCFGEVGGG